MEIILLLNKHLNILHLLDIILKVLGCFVIITEPITTKY
jgi:hypothetical protein